MSDAPRPAELPHRLLRTRLYEQVAEQITTWISQNGLSTGDRLPRSASSRRDSA